MAEASGAMIVNDKAPFKRGSKVEQFGKDVQLKALEARLKRAESVAERQATQIKSLFTICTEKGLTGLLSSSKKAHKDLSELHVRLQALILRTTVATELSFYCRHYAPRIASQVHAAMIVAFDEDDAWWAEKERLTLEQWVKLFLAKPSATPNPNNGAAH